MPFYPERHECALLAADDFSSFIRGNRLLPSNISVRVERSRTIVRRAPSANINSVVHTTRNARDGRPMKKKKEKKEIRWRGIGPGNMAEGRSRWRAAILRDHLKKQKRTGRAG